VRLLKVWALCVCLMTSMVTAAQQFDAAFGIGTVASTSAASVSTSSNYFPQDVGGGVFPGFSGDLLLKHRYGVEGEIFWRAGQNSYVGSQPFRPIFWDFNGIWAPQVQKHPGIELLAGIGEESVRFYQPFITCGFTCTNYTSIGHLMGDLGGGVRLYVTDHVFVRPEARLYLIHNNVEFSSGHATRLGVSIGYSFGGSQ